MEGEWRWRRGEGVVDGGRQAGRQAGRGGGRRRREGGRKGDRGRGSARTPSYNASHQSKQVKMETVCGMFFPLSLFGTEKYAVLLKLLTIYSLLTHKETFTTIN